MKSRSRREIISENKRLKHELWAAEFDRDDAIQKNKELKERIAKLGTRLDMEQADISCIEIKPVPFGAYCRVPNGIRFADVIDSVKGRLATQLATSLIEQNVVQFITNEEWLPNMDSTIGAKLYVVPWDRTVICRRRWGGGR